MRQKTKVAVLISGSGTNMAALLYASRTDDCPYEIVLVASNNPDAAGLDLAAWSRPWLSLVLLACIPGAGRVCALTRFQRSCSAANGCCRGRA